MRLIDADALEKDANEEDLFSCPDTVEEMYWNYGAKSIIDLIKTAPTVDPVKRGKWIHDDFGFHCSECWTEYPNEITDELNYCPNCGADMRETVSPCDGCDKAGNNCSFCERMDGE